MAGELGLFGGMNAANTRKKLLKKDLARRDAGLLGIGKSKEREIRETSMQDAGALIQASKLGGMPDQKFDPGMGKVIAQAGAAGAAQAAKLNEETALAQSAEIDAGLERQQDRARQNAQFWTGLLFRSAVGMLTGGASEGLDLASKGAKATQAAAAVAAPVTSGTATK